MMLALEMSSEIYVLYRRRVKMNNQFIAIYYYYKRNVKQTS